MHRTTQIKNRTYMHKYGHKRACHNMSLMCVSQTSDDTKDSRVTSSRHQTKCSPYTPTRANGTSKPNESAASAGRVNRGRTGSRHAATRVLRACRLSYYCAIIVRASLTLTLTFHVTLWTSGPVRCGIVITMAALHSSSTAGTALPCATGVCGRAIALLGWLQAHHVSK